MDKNNDEKKALEIDSFDFHLRKPVGYNVGGQSVRVDKLKVKAPGMGLLFEAYPLRQMVGKALMESAAISSMIAQYAIETPKLLTMDEEEKPDLLAEQTPAKAGESFQYLADFSRFPVKDAIDMFFELATAGCVLVKDMKINILQWNELRNDDKLDMLFQFIGVFIQPSIFKASMTEDSRAEEKIARA